MTYIIRKLNDPVLAFFSHDSIADMCVGKMSRARINGYEQHVTIGEEILEFLRRRYFVKEAGIYKRRESPVFEEVMPTNCACGLAWGHTGKHAPLPEIKTTIQNIGMLRQWLNENRITDPNKMVSNEDILHWLGWNFDK